MEIKSVYTFRLEKGKTIRVLIERKKSYGLELERPLEVCVLMLCILQIRMFMASFGFVFVIRYVYLLNGCTG